jgi:hypothetical protein
VLDGERTAVVDLLTEIRDHLDVIADDYRDKYEARQARQAAMKTRVAEMVNTTKRRAAWDLADGTRTQRQISKQANLAEGATSELFKALRELGAVEGDMPRRTMEVN